MALALGFGCQPPARTTSGTTAVPQVRATVITIRTIVQPSNETSVHTIVIGKEVARSTNEVQRWRLFDFKKNRVLFLDDVDRTYRRETVQSLIARHPEKPRAELVPTPERRSILGVTAVKTLIQIGGYQRELWIGEHPAIPPQLFAMMEASEGRPSLLTAVRGFPLADHSELPYGTEKFVADRAVVSVVSRDVPASILQIPRGYRDVTAPAAGRPPASSPPRDQTTPAAESPPSATDRTAP